MDIFGIKKRRAAKEARAEETVQVYAEVYRRMSKEERKQHEVELRHIVRTGFFRNQTVVDELQAVVRVRTEEASEAAEAAEAEYERVCIEEAEAVVQDVSH